MKCVRPLPRVARIPAPLADPPEPLTLRFPCSAADRPLHPVVAFAGVRLTLSGRSPQCCSPMWQSKSNTPGGHLILSAKPTSRLAASALIPASNRHDGNPRCIRHRESPIHRIQCNGRNHRIVR